MRQQTKLIVSREIDRKNTQVNSFENGGDSLQASQRLHSHKKTGEEEKNPSTEKSKRVSNLKDPKSSKAHSKQKTQKNPDSSDSSTEEAPNKNFIRQITMKNQQNFNNNLSSDRQPEKKQPNVPNIVTSQITMGGSYSRNKIVQKIINSSAKQIQEKIGQQPGVSERKSGSIGQGISAMGAAFAEGMIKKASQAQKDANQSQPEHFGSGGKQLPSKLASQIQKAQDIGRAPSRKDSSNSLKKHAELNNTQSGLNENQKTVSSDAKHQNQQFHISEVTKLTSIKPFQQNDQEDFIHNHPPIRTNTMLKLHPQGLATVHSIQQKNNNDHNQKAQNNILGVANSQLLSSSSSDSFHTDADFQENESSNNEGKISRHSSINSMNKPKDEEIVKKFLKQQVTQPKGKDDKDEIVINNFNIKRSKKTQIQPIGMGNQSTPNQREATDILLSSPDLPQDTKQPLQTLGEGLEFEENWAGQTNRPLNNSGNKQIQKRGSLQGKLYSEHNQGSHDDYKKDENSGSGVVNGIKRFFRLNHINSQAKQDLDGVNINDSDISADFNDQSGKEGYRESHPQLAGKWIFLPDDSFKIKWEMMISVILIFTAVTTPLLLAFSDSEDGVWSAINTTVDAMFGIDMIVCFFSAYEDENEELVHDRGIIAKAYIKSWFFIDLISILPVSDLLQTGDFSNLARISRLPKLYRLIRMVKLIRIMKIIKERNTISKYLNEVLKVSVALERLSFFCFIFAMLVHIIACFWVIISTFEDVDDNLIMRNKLQDYDAITLYVACFYYTTVIVTTIGYGDITVRTPLEQCFAILLLIIGVVGFSFAIGSLSSVITSLDAKAGKLQEKLETLNNIKENYRIPYDLYRRLRLALNYDHSKNIDEQQQLLNELPSNLKGELSMKMHEDIVKGIKFFKHRSPHFIAYVMPLLRPMKCEKGQYIFNEGDPIDEIYFLLNGEAGYVLPKYDNAVYVIIQKGYCFGEIDFISGINENGVSDGVRRFAAMALEDSDILILQKTDLNKIDEEYDGIVEELFADVSLRLDKIVKLKKVSKKFYKKLKKQRLQEQAEEEARQVQIESQQIKISSVLNPFFGGNKDVNTKVKENDQHAFIEEFKRKNLTITPNTGPLKKRDQVDMLDAMDVDQFDEAFGNNSSKHRQQELSEQSQDGEDNQSYDSREVEDIPEGTYSSPDTRVTYPEQTPILQIDDVDADKANTQNEGQVKENSSRNSSQQLQETDSEQEQRESQMTAQFDAAHSSRMENFSSALQEQGYEIRTHEDSSKQGGEHTFKNRHSMQNLLEESKQRYSTVTLGQYGFHALHNIEVDNEETKKGGPPEIHTNATSQKESERQLGSISETDNSESSKQSEEEKEQIGELRQNILANKDKKRSFSVLNDPKLMGFNFAGGLKKQPTMMQPKLHSRALVPPVQNQEHLQIPKTRQELKEELRQGNSGGTSSLSPLGSPAQNSRHGLRPQEEAKNKDWKKIKLGMEKKLSGQMLNSKTLQSTSKEFEKMREIKESRRRTHQLDFQPKFISSGSLQKDPNVNSEENYLLQKQAESEIKKLYGRLIDVIEKFEAMFGEKAPLVRDLNQRGTHLDMKPSLSISSLDLANSNDAEEIPLKAQITNLIWQVKRIDNEAVSKGTSHQSHKEQDNQQ